MPMLRMLSLSSIGVDYGEDDPHLVREQTNTSAVLLKKGSLIKYNRKFGASQKTKLALLGDICNHEHVQPAPQAFHVYYYRGI